MLVTGASGMLGRAVAEWVSAAGHQVVVLQRGPSGLDCEEIRADLSDQEAVARALTGVDAVIHLAAKVSITGDLREFERINVVGTGDLLDAAQRAGVQRFVYVSSPSVAHAGVALVGAGAAPANPKSARGAYSQTKAEAEVEVLARDAPGFATVAIRPHLVWGPGDTQLVARIVDRARSGRLFLINEGRALIDTTYIDNAVSALGAALDRVEDEGVHGRAFVVSNGQPRTVAELFTRMAQAAGAPLPTRSVPFVVARAGGLVAERAWRHHPRGESAGDPPMTSFLAEQLATAHWFDQRETRRLLDWAPGVSLEEGFNRLASWYSDDPSRSPIVSSGPESGRDEGTGSENGQLSSS